MRLRIMCATLLLAVAAGSLWYAPGMSAQCVYAPGTPVQLVGTPHLFVVGDDGLLHWAGDTRALAGRMVNWGSLCSARLAELAAAPRGDPWLTAGLPKVGDAIYLAKWEDTAATPTLLHIQAIADVELFGITGSNYGSFVLDQPAWEQRYGFVVSALPVGPLAAAASFAWSEADRAAYAQLLADIGGAQTAALARATASGIDAASALALLTSCERQALDTFDRERAAAGALALATECLGGAGAAGAPLPPSSSDPQRAELPRGLIPPGSTPTTPTGGTIPPSITPTTAPGAVGAADATKPTAAPTPTTQTFVPPGELPPPTRVTVAPQPAAPTSPARGRGATQ